MIAVNDAIDEMVGLAGLVEQRGETIALVVIARSLADLVFSCPTAGRGDQLSVVPKRPGATADAAADLRPSPCAGAVGDGHLGDPPPSGCAANTISNGQPEPRLRSASARRSSRRRLVTGQGR